MNRRNFIKSSLYFSSFSYLNPAYSHEKSAPKKLIVSPPLPTKPYIIKHKSASIGRIESYLYSLKKIGISRSEIDLPKINRKAPSHKLSKKEIKKSIIGKTLRRPCFDIFFSEDRLCKSSWVDRLLDVEKEVTLKERKKLRLTDPSKHVPIYTSNARWYWSGDNIFRDFGSLYGKALKTEFFYQDNGLLSMKSNNNNITIWYDLLLFDGDYVENFGVNWNDISNHLNIKSNRKREFQANAVPQFQGDKTIRSYS